MGPWRRRYVGAVYAQEILKRADKRDIVRYDVFYTDDTAQLALPNNSAMRKLAPAQVVGEGRPLVRRCRRSGAPPLARPILLQREHWNRSPGIAPCSLCRACALLADAWC